MTAPADADERIAHAVAVMLAAVLLADEEARAELHQFTGIITVEIDADALTAGVAAGYVEPGTDPALLTDRGRDAARPFLERYRRHLPACRTAVLSCPLCGDPGGYCGSGGEACP